MSDVWSWAGAIWRSNQGWDRPIFLAKAWIWQIRRRIGGKFVAKLVQFERLGRTNLDGVRRFFDEAQYTLFGLTEDEKITRDPAAIARPLNNLFACTSADFEMLARSDSAAR